ERAEADRGAEASAVADPQIIRLEEGDRGQLDVVVPGDVAQASHHGHRGEVVDDEPGGLVTGTNQRPTAELTTRQQRPAPVEAVRGHHSAEAASAERPVPGRLTQDRDPAALDVEREAVAIGLNAFELRIHLDPKGA